MMSAPEFQRLVQRMRALQREYFRTRNHDTLQEAKATERRVDQVLESYLPSTGEELFSLTEQ